MRARLAVGDRRQTRQGAVCPAEGDRGALECPPAHAGPDACRWWCRPSSLQAMCALRWRDTRLG